MSQQPMRKLAGRGSMMATIRAARERDTSLYIQVDCDNTSCPARRFTVFVRDYDETLVATLERQRGLRCPICGRLAVVHDASSTIGGRGDGTRSSPE